MKKGILLLTALATIGFTNAQTVDNQLKPLNLEKMAKGTEQLEMRAQKQNNRRDDYSDYYAQYSAIFQTVGGTDISVSFFTIYPDSNLVKISTVDGVKDETYFGVHTIGAVIDPKDILYSFDDPTVTPLSKFNSYTVDSMNMRYGYFRQVDSMMVGGVNTHVVDTLVVRFFDRTDLTLGGLTWNQNAQEHAGESERYGHPNSLDVKTALPINFVKEIKIPLDETDSVKRRSDGSWSFKQFDLEVDMNINSDMNANESTVFGYSVTFRPMKPSVFGDTMYDATVNPGTGDQHSNITNLHNYFGFPIWVNQSSDYLQTNNYNNLFFANTRNMYTGKDAEFLSRYTLGSTFADRYYAYSYFKLSTTTLGVEDVDANGYGLGQAYPNPVNSGNDFNVDFELGNNTEATVTLMDINGKVLSTKVVRGTQGTNTVSFETSNLATGIYMYSLTADNFTATKKFMVK